MTKETRGKKKVFVNSLKNMGNRNKQSQTKNKSLFGYHFFVKNFSFFFFSLLDKNCIKFLVLSSHLAAI